MFLSDNPFAPRQARLSDDLTIPAGGFIVVFVDDLLPQLSGATNGALFLTDSSARGSCTIDSFEFDYTELGTKTSLGREPDGGDQIRVLDSPTPGETNSGDPTFIRGDTNLDGQVECTDMTDTLSLLFDQAGLAFLCEDAADANDDGDLNLVDVIFTGNAIFLGGTPIPQPFPKPGEDPTPDALSCLGGG